MSQDRTCLQSADWYQAQTLRERAALLDRAALLHANDKQATDHAVKCLQDWQSQPPFTNQTLFRQRLAVDGLTESKLLHLLGQSADALRDGCKTPPAWLDEVESTFTQPADDDTISLPTALQAYKPSGFLKAIDPLMVQGRKRVRVGIDTMRQRYANVHFDPSTVEEVLWASLPGRLLRMMKRTMVLELNVARLQGRLAGDTTEARFQSFIEQLGDRPTALALLQEYPVLARQLITSIDQWVLRSLEFLQRLSADWERIRTTFSPERELGLLAQLEGGMGDRHRGGQSVMLARFSSGCQIVYKPRSMACDIHFQNFLDWLNQRGVQPALRTLNILDRGAYGWVEFVAAQPCTSVAEVQRFYERQGSYLAILYTLQATDFHFENLIAAGEHPMLLDLEALFHPVLYGSAESQANDIAAHSVRDSVLRIGLLPERAWANEESEGVDISGLGAANGQLTPFKVSTWEAEGTDAMRFTRKRVEMIVGRHRPCFNGADVDVMDYTHAIADGFTRTYQLLLMHRDELLSEQGPLADFAEDEVRVIPRATRTYGILLEESFHPDMLRNGLDRDRLFDRLWLQVEHVPAYARIIRAECEDLLNGDIPVFTTRPDSRDLWSGTGERMTDFFDESGMALVRRRVAQLNHQDLEKQLWFIHASMATMSRGMQQAPRSSVHPAEPQSVADREQLLAAAQAIGDRLEALALHGEDDVSWIGLVLARNDYWALAPLMLDLYNGLPGVALFLAYLGMMSQEERYTRLAQMVLTTIRRQIKEMLSTRISIGAFEGWGGIIYMLTHLGTLWQQRELLQEAEEIVQQLPDFIEQDETYDIIGGAAGCIGSCLALYRCAPSEQTKRVAIQCGERLLAGAQPMPQGIGWLPPFPVKGPLTGFAHGAAGIAWSLLELSGLTGEERFRTAALEAMAYERSLFVSEAGNWPDLRDLKIPGRTQQDGESTFMVAWCHGAAGIGLGRLQSLRYLPDTVTRAEIDIALKTTLAQGFGGNHSLCHGDLGNLEVLLQARAMLAEPQWNTPIDRLSTLILNSMHRDGWLTGVPLGVESPGFMTGLSGIGYGLLRLAEPVHTPSILALEPVRSVHSNAPCP
jgi:type 2 lantibiotic biosynthesis protein LanM